MLGPKKASPEVALSSAASRKQDFVEANVENRASVQKWPPKRRESGFASLLFSARLAGL
jgi:hypothetical protein